MFSFLNGLDKFLFGTTLLGLTWHGTDRSAQFSGYFERLGLPGGAVRPVLLSAGLVEVALAIPCALCTAALIGSGLRMSARATDVLHRSLVASAVLFVGFICFDIVVGDRAELLEHSTFIVLVLATFMIGLTEERQLSRG